MSNHGKPEPALTWAVQLRIPVPVRLARRASKTALEKYLARAVVGAIQTMPPEFIVKSAARVKADIKQSGASLVGADGRPYRM
jgi:hypothetical protein